MRLTRRQGHHSIVENIFGHLSLRLATTILTRNNPRLSYFSTRSFVPSDQSSARKPNADYRKSIFGEGSSFAPSDAPRRLYFSADKTEEARVREACRASSSDPEQSVGEFIRMVVLKEVERLEFEQNSGLPFTFEVEKPHN